MWCVRSEGFNPFKSIRVQPIAYSFFPIISSNRFSYSWSSWDQMIIAFACCVSRKVYFSVDGRVLSSNISSSNDSSSKLASLLIAITYYMQASISSSSQRSMAPKSSKAREGYFIILLMSAFTVCSPTFSIASPFPQSVTAFRAWQSSFVIFISTTMKFFRKEPSSILKVISSTMWCRIFLRLKIFLQTRGGPMKWYH